MNKKYFILLGTIYLFISCPVLALEYGGAIRQILQLQRTPANFFKSQKYIINQSLLRLWLNDDFGKVYFKSGFEFNSLYSGSNSFYQDAWQSPNNQLVQWNCSSKLQSKAKSNVSANIERFELSFTSGNYDFQIGRQPISLGTSHFIGLLDFIDPFYPGYLDSSYKPGVDAIRIRTSAGRIGEMELIGVAGSKSHGDTYLGRLRNTYSEIDCALMLGKFRNRNFLGLAFEGERRKVNLWGEMVAFERKKTEEPNLGAFSKSTAVSWIVGAEKEIRHRWRAGLAYMHQDIGYRSISDIGNVYASSPFKEGWTFLSASEYGLVTLNNEMNAMTNASINGIINLVDGSILWQPRITINTGDNSDISFFGWLPSGKSSGLKSMPPTVNSEFGSFSSGGGLIARFFF